MKELALLKILEIEKDLWENKENQSLSLFTGIGGLPVFYYMLYETETFNLPEITLSEGENIINASIISSNGSNDENSTNDNDSDIFNLEQDELFATTQVHLELLTDDFPQETTWEFRNLDGTILYTGGPYEESGTLFLEDFDVNENECYVFEIFDEAGDGICCGFGNGFYELTTDDLSLIHI